MGTDQVLVTRSPFNQVPNPNFEFAVPGSVCERKGGRVRRYGRLHVIRRTDGKTSQHRASVRGSLASPAGASSADHAPFPRPELPTSNRVALHPSRDRSIMNHSGNEASGARLSIEAFFVPMSKIIILDQLGLFVLKRLCGFAQQYHNE